MKQKMVGLIKPMAAVGTMPTEGWYRIKGASGGVVDLDIMGDIGGWGVTARQFATELKEVAKDASLINVDLHSLGGDVIEGMAIYNMLKNHPAKVHINIIGIAASMGSVIAMAGDVVRIPVNAWVMVHSPWGIQGGNATEMREYADLLDNFGSSMLLTYTTKTGKTDEEIQAFMDAETWFVGAEAVEQGFADELVGAVEVAASINSKRAKDFEKMPKAAQQLMAPRGQGGGAPEGAAPQSQPQPAPNSPAAPSREQVLAAEKKRRTDIRGAFSQFEGHQVLLDECLDDPAVTLAQAREKLLTAMGSSSPAEPARGGYAAHVNVGNGNIVRDHMTNAIAARAGIETLESDNGLRGYTLQEMARASLTERGISIYGMDRLEMIAMAFTHSTSDFGNILQNVANKALLKGVEEAAETFHLWTQKGTLTDFKVTDRVGLDAFPSLAKVAEGAEYKNATIGDKAEQIQLATYGRLFSISRQTIINDDLQAFTKMPMKMGRAAIRTVGDLVYALLMSNPKMKDGKALFHADHNNILTAAALGVSSLEAGATQMALQKDSAGAVLNIEPAHLIVPRASKATAQALMTSIYDPFSDKPNAPNTAHGMCDVVADARIDAALSSGAKLPWFLAAGGGFDTVEVAYLDGNDKPYLEQQDGWKTDGAEFKVRIDAGVSALSYRTLAKNLGA